MDPVPESNEAFDDLDVNPANDELRDTLIDASERVRELVPDCIGLSYTLFEQGVTFTLLATAEEIAALDAVQYVADGPCVQSVMTGTVVAAITGDAMIEEGWQLFAQATAAFGVRSTLSLPVLAYGVVVAGFNLYGSSQSCFEAHHDDIAGVLGAWSAGATTNADLGFSTLLAARLAPEVARDAALVQTAYGLLAGVAHIDIEVAEERLLEASRRAGTTPTAVARLLMITLGGPDPR